MDELWIVLCLGFYSYTIYKHKPSPNLVVFSSQNEIRAGKDTPGFSLNSDGNLMKPFSFGLFLLLQVLFFVMKPSKIQ